MRKSNSRTNKQPLLRNNNITNIKILINLHSKTITRFTYDRVIKFTNKIFESRKWHAFFKPLKIYNGTPKGRLNRDLRATLPIKVYLEVFLQIP